MNSQDLPQTEEDLPLFRTKSPEPHPETEKVVAESSDSSHDDFGKYIVYVDESGDHAMKSIDKHYPVFALAFCVFHKSHYSEKVVSALENFKFKHFGHDQVVLHEHEIRKEKGAFRIFPTRAHKENFLRDLTVIIEESNFILISCVIDKKRLKEQQERPPNPYHIALRYCLETLHDFLEEKNESEKLTHVIVEQRGPKEDNDLELEFRRICDGQNSKEANLPFEVLFADKKAMSSGLQLADLVARPIGLGILRKGQANRAFDILKEKFYCAGGRDKLGQNFEGYGLKIHPPLKSEKPQ